MKSFNCASQVGKTFQEFSPFFFFFLFGFPWDARGCGCLATIRLVLARGKAPELFFFSSPVWHLKNEIIISRAGRRHRPCCCCCCSIHGPSSITSSFRFRSTDEFTSSSTPPPYSLRSIHSNDIHRTTRGTRLLGQFLSQRMGTLPTRFRVSTALYRTRINTYR